MDESQLKEIRDTILDKKAEEMRYLFMKLDADTVWQLNQWSNDVRDKYPHFFRESLAVLAIKNLYVMCDTVLGYNASRYGADMSRELHGAICNRLDNRPANRLGWLIAREHLKTQVITIGDTIRRIAKDPNPRILIASGIRDNAVKMLGVVKNQWENNAMLQYLYPYRLPSKKQTWNEDALVFGGRHIPYKEPTLEARGIESEFTSAHYDVGKFDDLVGKENSRTDEQLAKTLEWWRLAQPLLTPKAELDIVGTRYADGDLYGHLIEGKSPIKWMRVPATKKDPVTGDNLMVNGRIVPVWPEYHTIDSLEQKMVDMGGDYASQMDLDPIPVGSEEFKEHFFYLYDDHEIDLTKVRNRGSVCDPAYKRKEKAAKNVTPDFSVLMTGGWHSQFGLVVVDIDHGQVGTEVTVDWMHKHQSTWGSKLGVEAHGSLSEYIDKYNQTTRGKFIRYVELSHNNLDKDSRIRTLIPIAAKQPIWLPKKNPHSMTIIKQFMRFPRSKKRDLMDALAYLPQMVRAVKSGKAEATVTFTMEHEPDNEVTGY